MTPLSEIRVSVDSIATKRQAKASIAVVGVPNSGKSTLFNRLTGLRQRIGNYPGVTVERHIGQLNVDDDVLELIDLPGIHSLSPHSQEERIASDVILGAIDESAPLSGILAVLDATNLHQGLFLLQQLIDLELPLLVALTMTDAAEKNGTHVDVEKLERGLGGVSIVPVVATTGAGLKQLRESLIALPTASPSKRLALWPELADAAEVLLNNRDNQLSRGACERLLVNGSNEYTDHYVERLGSNGAELLRATRSKLIDDGSASAAEARIRYAWIRELLPTVQRSAPRVISWRTHLIDFLNRPLAGTLGLFIVMAVVFQAVFAWATPLMELIDGGTAALGGMVANALGDTAFSSLVSDGIIAGVGSVLIFLPQIFILFLFIILLEDSGYLARAAYLLDRGMRSVGLSGQSIIPMISSFACAVPGIMATRVIPNRRDRIATILAAPFMTCSARLPVYALLIAAFVPAQNVGFLNLQGLVLFALYLFGIVMGVLTALLLRQTALRGEKPPFALMLPEFRRPNLQTVLMQLLGKAKVFLYRAGTVIFAVAVIIWALAYFPRMDFPNASETSVAIVDVQNERAAAQLEQSWLGRAGKFVEPAFAPLGWDWRVSSAVIAGFPAREVVIAVLGTVYAVGDEADDKTLSGRLKASTWPDGRPVFTLPMVIGLLIFYACCLQCAATLAVIRRETNSWRWPIFAWVYMTSIGYVGALLAFQIGSP